MGSGATGPTPEEDAAEEELRRVTNLVISYGLLFLLLFALPFLYEQLRPMLDSLAPSNTANPPPTLLLPAMPRWLGLTIRAGSFVFYLLAIRIVLQQKPRGGRGLIVAIGVAFIAMGVLLGLAF